MPRLELALGLTGALVVSSCNTPRPALHRPATAGLGSSSAPRRRRPIARAAVSIHATLDSGTTLGPMIATSRAGEDGRFTASFLRPGRYQVQGEDLSAHAVSEIKRAEVKAEQTVDAAPLEIQ
jgi:hypothetical protein